MPPSGAVRIIGLCAWCFAACLSLRAADTDESLLPPPAGVRVVFSRDIQPILQSSCLRCHGPEKPRSGFRLDNRASALKGGEHGVDILPGHSAKSPLIQYVAYAVEDMEMPPVGKGTQLTAEQVALLRAWIDQGASWSQTNFVQSAELSLAPAFGWTFVHGDERKFRELYWQDPGANGGLENFDFFQQSSPDTRVRLDGHALRDHYQLALSLDTTERGFVHAGWDQYRKFYDDLGGFTPALGTSSLDRQLYLDIGKAWIDFGLTLPDWPRLVLGYEYDYKRGTEATTSWGSAGEGASLRNSAPAAKALDEAMHVIKFDLDDDLKGVAVEERFRGQFYSLNTHATNEAARGPVANDTREGTRYFQGANTLRLEKQFYPWLFCSAGYLFSKLDSTASFSDAVTYDDTLFLSQVPNITLEKISHVLNLNGIIGPFHSLTISTGVQSEWTRENGTGAGTLNGIAYTLDSPTSLALNSAALSSDYDESDVQETLNLRYSRIPFTALFVDFRAQQERIGQSDSDLQSAGSFMENPRFGSQMTDIRAGFSTSPWRSAELSAHYRRYENDSRYQTNEPPQPAGGYPGFLRERDVLTDEVETRLVLHPCPWLRTTLTYQYLTTAYRNDSNPAFNLVTAEAISPGGDLLAGRYRSQVCAINATLTPCARLVFSATYSYQPTSISTMDAGSPSLAPCRGAVHAVLADGTFMLNPATSLFANYSFSAANYAQDNSASGLPLGIQYEQHTAQFGATRRFGKRSSARLQYTWFGYSEPTAGAAADFHASSIFASFNWRLQ
jgi:hypothetical protein